ncbi:hypothetical protein ACU686_21845 [Yinghuangia aomiensis]
MYGAPSDSPENARGQARRRRRGSDPRPHRLRRLVGRQVRQTARRRTHQRDRPNRRLAHRQHRHRIARPRPLRGHVVQRRRLLAPQRPLRRPGLRRRQDRSGQAPAGRDPSPPPTAAAPGNSWSATA